jgi:protease-4
MSNAQHGPIRRFFGGIWSGLNFTRQLVFNLIFLFIVVAVLMAIVSSPGVQPVEEKTALVLNLEGNLVQQFSSSPVDRVLGQLTGEAEVEIQLRDAVRAIEAAKDDKTIDRIVLLTDGFNVAGFAALRDLSAALRDFRASGKQVVAWATNMEQKQYSSPRRPMRFTSTRWAAS